MGKVVPPLEFKCGSSGYLNAALIAMCDNYLGKILDLMDKYDLWKDTMLIVNTDHGFLLGEHDWWGKCLMPLYNEIANTPLFIWRPYIAKKGERRQSLVQTIDIPATILDFFKIQQPEEMQGRSLFRTLDDDIPVRKAGLFGVHGGQINVTDGRYVYMRAPLNYGTVPLYQYTHMPAHMRTPFSVQEMRTMQWHPGFSFTKGCPVMKIGMPEKRQPNGSILRTYLFDLDSDPKQEHPIKNPEIEKRMIELMTELMIENEAPEEQFQRIAMTRPGPQI